MENVTYYVVTNDRGFACLQTYWKKRNIEVNIVSEIREDLKGKRVDTVMSAIGAGLCWGSAHVELDHIVCPEIGEI